MDGLQRMDFLTQPTPERLRREIRNICDSYSNPWDVVAELCQNAVDAITLHQKRFGEEVKNHKIDIAIDARDRAITIYDTGVGFDTEKFVDLLAPHGTDKRFSDPVIGQKGVGLTYVIFSSDNYKIETKSTGGHISGHIENAVAWKKEVNDNLPEFISTRFEQSEFSPADTFTSISAKGIEVKYEESEDIFYQQPSVLEFILRTKTAIGSLRGCLVNNDEGLNVDVTLTFIDRSGNRHPLKIKPQYMLPSEFIQDELINLDEFKSTAATLDDRQKARQLQGRCLVKSGAVNRAGRSIKFYCFFAPSRRVWDNISNMNDLTTIDSTGEQIRLYEGGIYIASRGMPTGISLNPPVTGAAGYWPNFYIVLEDDSIVFDLGRKSIPGRTQGLLKDIARNLFYEFLPFREYVTTDPAVSRISTVQQFEKQRQFNEFQQLPDVSIDEINILKHPDEQEAGVVALFHELVGAGILKGYYTLQRGYKMTYDLWGIYRIHRDEVGSNFRSLSDKANLIELPIVIEFKFRAESILRDLEKNRKFFTDMDLIVCWDLNESEFAKQGVKVEVLQAEDQFFYGSNYKLIWPGAYNLGSASEKPVLALRKFVQDYVSNS